LIRLFIALFALSLLGVGPRVKAQENPYFVTYDHNLEEPGNLEVEYFSTFGTQRAGNDFHAFWMEFEYGVTAWWTTELYLDAQTTFKDSTIFTGVKWENRFRPLKREHFINPVLYVEFEHKSDADKTLKEGEGLDVEDDFLAPNSELRRNINNEVELKLILSSNFKGWNFSENTLAAKNLTNEPWEFGYALAASRPLAPWRSKHLPSAAVFARRISSWERKCMEAWATVTTLACGTPLTIWRRQQVGICRAAGRYVSRQDGG
jgi:hypothetical protein